IAAEINLGPGEVEYLQGILREYQVAADRLWDEHVERLEQARDRMLLRSRAGAGAGSAPKAKASGVEPRRPNNGPPLRDKAAEGEEAQFHRRSIALHEGAVRLVSQALSRKQKLAFNRLLGEPFDLTALLPDGARSSGSSQLRPGGEGATLPPA